MEGVRPCPYCGGEVEVIKLARKKNDKHDVYRIECRVCHRLEARGERFPIETLAEGMERINQYKKIVTNKPGLIPSIRKRNKFYGYNSRD